MELSDYELSSASKLTLADQVYDVLRQEIGAGHWAVGDRLPTIADLAKTAGIGRAPVEQAMARLRDEGFLVQKRRAGTFLASTCSANDQGVLGLLLLRHTEPDRVLDNSGVCTACSRTRRVAGSGCR